MSAPYDDNRYRATILRHIDADTTHARLHLGFDVAVDATLRWAGIDAPERFTDAGKVATAMVNHWLPVGSTCEVATIKSQKEKFGRYLAVFWLPGMTMSLNDYLVELGHAVPYDGGTR